MLLFIPFAHTVYAVAFIVLRYAGRTPGLHCLYVCARFKRFVHATFVAHLPAAFGANYYCLHYARIPPHVPPHAVLLPVCRVRYALRAYARNIYTCGSAAHARTLSVVRHTVYRLRTIRAYRHCIFTVDHARSFGAAAPYTVPFLLHSRTLITGTLLHTVSRQRTRTRACRYCMRRTWNSSLRLPRCDYTFTHTYLPHDPVPTVYRATCFCI